MRGSFEQEGMQKLSEKSYLEFYIASCFGRSPDYCSLEARVSMTNGACYF